MTQKELLYVEDAIGHEKNMIAYLNDMIQSLSDDSFEEALQEEIKTHDELLKNLLKLLEDESNE